MRYAILGNSGSGKSTIARWLAAFTNAPLLDLDTVYWEPGKVAVPRSPEATRSDVHAFCSKSPHWIVEGCYASLVEVALEYSPRMIFLNPGEAQCLANCRARPWESHKFASRSQQDKHLDFLLNWVSEYYTHDGEMSLAGHQACFAEYSGSKFEVTTQPQIDPPSALAIAWVS